MAHKPEAAAKAHAGKGVKALSLTGVAALGWFPEVVCRAPRDYGRGAVSTGPHRTDAHVALNAFANVFRIAELRTRLAYTLALLAVYRLGIFINTPGRGPRGDERLHGGAEGSAAAW